MGSRFKIRTAEGIPLYGVQSILPLKIRIEVLRMGFSAF